jgi:broad specificity phosphatase PhoE
MKIYLLRHGETDWSKCGRLQGRTDIPLNSRGIEQIEAVGKYFSHTGEKIDVIISSPLSRARKSAEILAEKTGFPKEKIVTEPNFAERCFGLGEGLDPEERAAKLAGLNWNMESIADLTKRTGVIHTYAKQHHGKTSIIVAHGAIIKAILVSVTKGAFSYNEGLAPFGTGEFCLLEYDGENYTLIFERKNRKKKYSNSHKGRDSNGKRITGNGFVCAGGRACA